MKPLLLVLLGVAGVVLVVWGAVRAYRRAPRFEDTHEGVGKLHNLDGGDPVALTLQLAGAAIAFVAVVLSAF